MVGRHLPAARQPPSLLVQKSDDDGGTAPPPRHGDLFLVQERYDADDVGVATSRWCSARCSAGTGAWTLATTVVLVLLPFILENDKFHRPEQTDERCSSSIGADGRYLSSV
jgi:hypothetical protein